MQLFTLLRFVRRLWARFYSHTNLLCKGHGGQVRDPDGDRASGYDDTIVPVDFETNGQIDSDTLHKHLVSRLAPSSTLFVIFDCCHSGSAIELPFVYRTDDDGNVNLMDNVKEGLGLIGRANNLIQGGFSMNKVQEAQQLYAGARTFFHSLMHANEQQQQGPGLGEEQFMEDWSREHKYVTMFSGCKDDQTSADANIMGVSCGAMSWAFLQVMKGSPNPTYLEVSLEFSLLRSFVLKIVQTLQATRAVLKQSSYQQIPQLSVGIQMDLNQPLVI